MDDITTQTHIPTSTASTNNVDHVAMADMHYRNKKRIVIIAVSIIAAIVIVAAGIFWYIKRQAHTLTPAQTMQRLNDTSTPVTTTPDQRATDLQKMQAASLPDYSNTSGQLDMLDRLSK